MPITKLTFHPATPARWPDVEELFGERGACGGCWCMTWRLPRAKFLANQGPTNKRSFRKIVRSGAQPGVLAYADGKPVGWCAVAPRSEFSFLDRSRVLAPVDDQPVWSVTCFFVAKEWRRRGLSVKLLKAAVAFAGKRGAKIVEGYPQEPPDEAARGIRLDRPGLGLPQSRLHRRRPPLEAPAHHAARALVPASVFGRNLGHQRGTCRQYSRYSSPNRRSISRSSYAGTKIITNAMNIAKPNHSPTDPNHSAVPVTIAPTPHIMGLRTYL